MTTIHKKFTSGGKTYEAEITFETMEEASAAGANYVRWLLQRQAREGQLKDGVVLKVNHLGQVFKSTEELVEELDQEKALQMLKALQARFSGQDAKVDTDTNTEA